LHRSTGLQHINKHLDNHKYVHIVELKHVNIDEVSR
jgi:hypothetical protein